MCGNMLFQGPAASVDQGCALKGRAPPTKPEIVCEGKRGHFDELFFGVQTDSTIVPNVRCLVRIADPSAH
eukprot:2085771-Pyramimonas_sp.AAC.1